MLLEYYLSGSDSNSSDRTFSNKTRNENHIPLQVHYSLNILYLNINSLALYHLKLLTISVVYIV